MGTGRGRTFVLGRSPLNAIHLCSDCMLNGRNPMIKDDLKKKMMKYTAAAVATAALPALIPAAEARVIYIPTNQSFSRGIHPVNLRTGAVFTFKDQTPGSLSGVQYRYFSVTAANGGLLYTGGVLQTGTSIGPANQFGSELKLTKDIYSDELSAFYCYGACNVQDGFLGIEFTFNGATHYGWARLNVTTGYTSSHPGSPTIDVTITGFAYESTSGTPIAAGDIGQGVAQRPEPGSLGMLALGAVTNTK